MKNISVTDKVWKELRQVRDELRDELGIKHYSKTIQHLIMEHKSFKGERTKNGEKQKHKSLPEETSNFDDDWGEE